MAPGSISDKPATTLARRLARWVVGLRYEDLSAEAVFHAKRCMLDTLGTQIRGATLPWIQPVYRYARSLGGDAATVTYHGDRLSAPYAAYVNSTFSYSCELQHHGSYGSAHPGVTVIPVIQALGEQLGSNGREMMVAMAAGYEVQGRFGAVLFAPLFKRHFHPQGVLGVFSAAAAAGRLLGLDETQMAHAFAIAGSHSSAILEYDQTGGEVKRIYGAMAARNGMQSAFLAKEGLTGPLSVFEGKRGIFASFGGMEADPGKILAGIGEPYCISLCRYRIYSTVAACHPTLDIVNDLVAAHRFDFRDVESIEVGMPEINLHHVISVKRPHDAMSAQASLGFSVGVLLVTGDNGLERYLDPALRNDSRVLAIVDKLQAHPLTDPSAPLFTRVKIRLKDGRALEGETTDYRGSEGMPFSDEIMENKFRGLAGVVLPKDRVDHIVRTVARLDELPSMSQLVPALIKN
jgi:2-methylcitrate dehydratase PrpD